MTKQPLVSIIVPVYNVEKYLSQCIDSLINQTHSNLEILLINDGSTDSSLLICEKYASKDSRLIIVNQANKGVAEARNLGVNLCKGDYISFVDADDFIDLNMYKICVKEIQTFNFPDLLFFGFNKISPNGKILSQIVPELSYIENIQKQKGLLAKQLARGTGLAVWDKIIKKTFIEKYNISIINYKNGEDINYVFNLLESAKSILFLNQSFYYYRLSMGGSVKRIDDNIVISHISNFKLIYLFFSLELNDLYVAKYLKSIFLNWFVLVIPMYYNKFSLFKSIFGIDNIATIYKDKELMGYYKSIKSTKCMIKIEVLNMIFLSKSPLIMLITGKFFRFIRNKLKIVN